MRAKRIISAIAALAFGAGIAVAAAAPAQAACGSSGTFCAYDDANYVGLLVQSTTTANQTVDVADDRVASYKNQQSRRWCAMDTNAVGGNYILFYAASKTNNSYVGADVVNRTNFFWPGGTGSC